MKSAKHIYPRDQHNISRSHISDNALKVLYRLRENGYAAYLVGGSVRDLLLGIEPKDFDVATDAQPEEIRKIFKNCRLIGRRFRLAHIFFQQEIIEVATFRANANTSHEDRTLSESGMILRDNVFGSMEEDAWRRDFSINALYYNIADFSVVDFTGGMQDLQQGVIRLIGDPELRYREDPVRMLRAIRFAAKLGMQIHPHTEKPIHALHHLLLEVSPARLFEEITKLFHGGHANETFHKLRQYGLFGYLFPQTEHCLKNDATGVTENMLTIALQNTDDRVREDKPVTPAFLFAVLLWMPLQNAIKKYEQLGEPDLIASDKAVEHVINQQIKSVTIPRRFSSMMHDIWKLQYRLNHRQGKRAWRIFSHRRFRAAYDFLMIRASQDPNLVELSTWWTEFQYVSDKEKTVMIEKLRKQPKAKKVKKQAEK